MIECEDEGIPGGGFDVRCFGGCDHRYFHPADAGVAQLLPGFGTLSIIAKRTVEVIPAFVVAMDNVELRYLQLPPETRLTLIDSAVGCLPGLFLGFGEILLRLVVPLPVQLHSQHSGSVHGSERYSMP